MIESNGHGETYCPEPLATGDLISSGTLTESRLVAPGECVDDATDRDLRPSACRGLADRPVREQAAGDQERPPDLLVRGDRDRGESRFRGHIRGRDQQARLADARLALQGQRTQPALRVADDLGDRGELRRAPHDRAARPPQLDRERALRLHERVKRIALEQPDRSGRGLGCLTHHRIDYARVRRDLSSRSA